jgi:hypothetical protein
VLANAESSITKPSVPEFTVKFVDHSYDVPPTYGIDPYTGKNVMTQAGYHVQDETIEVAIKNQPFTSYKDANGNFISLYYSVRMKGHFGDSWTYPDYGYYYVEGKEVNYVEANMSSDFTVITYGLVGDNGTTDYLCLDISAGGQADFQVQAFIGYDNRTTSMTALGESHRDVFTGETSDWSNTQTLTIPASTSISTSSPSPTSTPDQTTEPTPKETPQTLQSEVVIVAVVAVALVVAGLLVYFKKRSRGQPA